MTEPEFENRYSGLQQWLYRLAFATPGLQVALADLESRMYADELSSVSVDRPVFVAGLPRAGTTLALNLLQSSGEFVSHSYRQLPFLHVPLAWHRFQSLFQRNELSQQRAHGDAGVIDSDSVEAFEEMLWSAFWTSRYEGDRIKPWGSQRYPRFDHYLDSHLRKMLVLGRWQGAGDRCRYLSKNNQNIARLPYLAELYSDSCIVIPFREPLAQARSLLRQHRQFLQMHKHDSFSRLFMAGIGHYEFGANLLPIDFGGWVKDAGDANELTFWLQYWLAAYGRLATHAPESAHWLSYEQLLTQPDAVLAALAEAVDIDSLAGAQEQIAASAVIDNDAAVAVAPALLQQATTLYQELLQRTCV